MADFLVALAHFDRRRAWSQLGHANLFAFLLAELGLSPAPTYWRQEAARLLQRFPELERPLREGKLCLTSMGELAKVLTEENQAAVLPRFLGISTREAKEVVAELQPRESPPMRTVVRPLVPAGRAEAAMPGLRSEAELPLLTMPPSATAIVSAAPAGLPQPGVAQNMARGADSESIWAPKLQGAYPTPDDPRRLEPRRDEVDPLTAELSRLSTTVSRRFLQKLKTAREGLGHAIPRATTEQVLEAALDLLLEKQARARGQVRKPRRTISASPTDLLASLPDPSQQPVETSQPTEAPQQTPTLQPTQASVAIALPTPAEPPPHRRDGPRAAIPAAVKRAVWARDAGRCSWPLDGGGCCGSTLRLELDHIVPWADWGGDQETNLRLTCAAHNRLAAQQAFGERVMKKYRGVREAVAEYRAEYGADNRAEHSADYRAGGRAAGAAG
jgi:hypothetical protein